MFKLNTFTYTRLIFVKLCSHFKQYYPMLCSGWNCFCHAMSCRPVVHACFPAANWLIALVYRGIINDVTIIQAQMYATNGGATGRSVDNRGYYRQVRRLRWRLVTETRQARLLTKKKQSTSHDVDRKNVEVAGGFHFDMYT